MLTLSFGTVFSQIIIIFFSPVLTRLYGPSAFGILAIFLSITSILGVIGCLRYECAIVLSETDNEAINLLGLCILFVLCTTAISVLLFFFGSDFIAHILNAPEIGNFLWLVPVSLFFSGMFSAFNY